MTEGPPSGRRGGSISTRSVEIAVALILFAFGATVVYDSERLGSSWGSDGPEAGYFPFYIGLIICISSGVNFASAAFGAGARSRKVFVEWQPLRQVAALLLPAALYILGIQ